MQLEDLLFPHRSPVMFVDFKETAMEIQLTALKVAKQAKPKLNKRSRWMIPVAPHRLANALDVWGWIAKQNVKAFPQTAIQAQKVLIRIAHRNWQI